MFGFLRSPARIERPAVATGRTFCAVVTISSAFLLAFHVAADAAGPLASSGDRVLPEEKRAVGKIVGKYRLARRDFDAKRAAVEEAIAFGRPAVEAIMGQIAQEFYPQLQGYRRAFFKKAAGLAEKQILSVDLQEVQQLRDKVLGLQDRPDFSKDLIVAEGDPALQRLEEIFVVDRATVLADDEDLLAQREQLEQIGSLWEACAQFIWQEMPEGDDKPDDPPSFADYLEGEERLAAGVATPMGDKARSVLAQNGRLASRLDPEEARAILALNLTRNLLGLNPVLIDLQLCAAARDHSQDMKREGFFAHKSPLPGKTSPWDRAKNFGTTASAENIAAGYQDGRAANRAWFHSPGHHKNMLGNHRRVGMGRAGTHYTEMFGR